MTVTTMTWIVAVGGLVLIALLGALQAVAVVRPRDQWTIDNVYGGQPSDTDPAAYFAFNRGFAIADVFVWVPLQVAGSVGMLAGERWGFLLALMASVPFCYTAIQFFVWDRDLGFRKPTATYWIVVWGMWPAFGVLEALYCLVRLTA
jgi:hypothetical protein